MFGGLGPLPIWKLSDLYGSELLLSECVVVSWRLWQWDLLHHIWFFCSGFLFFCFEFCAYFSDMASPFIQQFLSSLFSFFFTRWCCLMSSFGFFFTIDIYKWEFKFMWKFLAPLWIQPRSSRSEGECSNCYASRPRQDSELLEVKYLRRRKGIAMFVQLTINYRIACPSLIFLIAISNP